MNKGPGNKTPYMAFLGHTSHPLDIQQGKLQHAVN